MAPPRRIDVPRLLRALGIEAKRQGARWVALCPYPSHLDSKPSWSIVDDPGTERHAGHHCFSCKFGGGPWELVAAVKGLGLEDAFDWLVANGLARRRRDAPPPSSVEVRVEELARVSARLELPAGVVIGQPLERWFAPAREYLERRGVPPWQVERWRIGYATSGKLAHRVVVPVVTAGELVTYSARSYLKDEPLRYNTARERHGARPKQALFGEPGFDGTDTATVAEGAFSMLALERAGWPNPCAMLGSDVTPARLLLLSRFRRLLIATDPDPSGHQAARRIAAALGRGRTVLRVELSASPDDLSFDDLRGSLEEHWRRLSQG